MLLAYSLFSTYFLLKMTFNSLILAKRSSSNLFTRSVLGEVLVYNSNSDWLLPEGPSSLNILSRIVKIGFMVYYFSCSTYLWKCITTGFIEPSFLMF